VVCVCVCMCVCVCVCVMCREELVSYYKQLSDAADLRTERAQWRIRRHRLHEQRADLSQSESAWASSFDKSEVLFIAVGTETVMYGDSVGNTVEKK